MIFKEKLSKIFNKKGNNSGNKSTYPPKHATQEYIGKGKYDSEGFNNEINESKQVVDNNQMGVN